MKFFWFANYREIEILIKFNYRFIVLKKMSLYNYSSISWFSMLWFLYKTLICDFWIMQNKLKSFLTMRVLTWISIVLTKISSIQIKYIHKTKFYMFSIFRSVEPAALLPGEGFRGWHSHINFVDEFTHLFDCCRCCRCCRIEISFIHISNLSSDVNETFLICKLSWNRNIN